MPRVEIIPGNWDTSDEKRRGDGTPTIDVCGACCTFFEEGGAPPLYLLKRYPKCSIGSTDVAHPPYMEFDAYCDCCGDTLDDEDH